MSGFFRTRAILRRLLAVGVALPLLLSLWAGTAEPAAAHVQVAMATAADGAVHHDPVHLERQDHPGCTQHDAGMGSCCVSCGHCAGLYNLVASLVRYQPVLTARVTQLSSFDFPSPRERPPRILDV